MEIGTQQRDELLGGEFRIGDGQRAGLIRATQKRLDLRSRAFRPGAPEHLAQLGEAHRLGDRDAIDRDRVWRQHQFEKALGDLVQRFLDVARVKLPRREAAEIAFALARHDRAEQLLLAREIRIERRLRRARLARDRVHADRAEAARQKRAPRRRENALRLLRLRDHGSHACT
jgi:hypothetical protein